MKKIYLLIIALVAGSLPSLAQQEAVLHSMRSLPQAQSTNPAFIPQQQFYIGLPSAYLSLANSGFNYNSVVDLDENGKPKNYNLSRLQNSLGKKNYFSVIGQAEVFSIGAKINSRLYLNFNTSLKGSGSFMYPEGFTALALSGNAAYLGEKLTLSPSMDMLAYLEMAVGGSYIVNKKLTVGSRLKLLKGIGNIRTEESDFSLYTDPETYVLTLTGNMHAKAAGVLYDYLKEDGKGTDSLVSLRYSDLNNNGFAIDLGATYKVNNRLELGFSLLNLGSINWKSGGREIYMEEFSMEFKGTDIQGLLNGEEVEEEGQGLTDKLKEEFVYEDREGSPYRTGIPTQFYLSARYELLRNLHANGMLFSEVYNGRFIPAFSAGINKDFGRRLSTSVSYTAANRSYSNIGAGLAFRLTPIQFYLVSDNIISTPVFYRSAKALNIRMGFNIVFGYRKSESKLPSAN